MAYWRTGITHSFGLAWTDECHFEVSRADTCVRIPTFSPHTHTVAESCYKYSSYLTQVSVGFAIGDNSCRVGCWNPSQSCVVTTEGTDLKTDPVQNAHVLFTYSWTVHLCWVRVLLCGPANTFFTIVDQFWSWGVFIRGEQRVWGRLRVNRAAAVKSSGKYLFEPRLNLVPMKKLMWLSMWMAYSLTCIWVFVSWVLLQWFNAVLSCFEPSWT